jgi:3-dehydroquinate dehydratase type I
MRGSETIQMSVIARNSKRKLAELEGPTDKWDSISARPSAVHSRSTSQSYSPNSRDRRTNRHVHNAPQQPSQISSQDDSYLDSLPPSLPVSGRSSPTPVLSRDRQRRVFNPNASIALIGISGSGKSSLAVILSRATGRRLVDADQYFQQVTGLQRPEYIRTHTTAQYRSEEVNVLSRMLTDLPEGCVITCGPGSMERRGQQLLKRYAKTHPVIHVIRDLDSIQGNFKVWDRERVNRLMEIAGPIHRGCSNLEFFNVSETGFRVSLNKDDTQNSLSNPGTCEGNTNNAPSLTLKRVERDFLNFVAFSTGNKTDLMKLQSSFPLSLLPIESRPYTYAVSVALSSLAEKGLDIEELESTCDAFEIRIDESASPSSTFILSDHTVERISQNLAIVRRNIIVPIIYHVQSYNLFGQNASTRREDDEYLQLVEHGLQLAPEFITVDLSYKSSILERVIDAKGSTRVIGHYSPHELGSSGWDDEEYLAKYELASKLGCDMVRLSQPAATVDDNFAVERFRHRVKAVSNSKLPVIAYNSGPLGRLSSCFNPILTPVTHPSVRTNFPAREDAYITVQDAQTALFASFTLDALKFYVFGANTAYSLSPAMHNAAFKACGMPHEYAIYEAPSLRDLSTLVQDPNWGGCSVSLPYKTEVIPLLHSMSRHASAIGAVNTLIPVRTNAVFEGTEEQLHLERNRAGPVKAIYGDNTDWIGIYRSLRRGLSPANAVRPSSTGLVIGAGGMARAAIYAMKHLGVRNVFLYNRTLENAKRLAEHYNRQSNTNAQQNMYTRPEPKTTVHVINSLQDPWPEDYRQPTLVSCCIPAHSIGGVPAANFEMPLQWLESPTGGVVVDVRPHSLWMRSPLTS